MDLPSSEPAVPTKRKESVGSSFSFSIKSMFPGRGKKSRTSCKDHASSSDDVTSDSPVVTTPSRPASNSMPNLIDVCNPYRREDCADSNQNITTSSASAGSRRFSDFGRISSDTSPPQYAFRRCSDGSSRLCSDASSRRCSESSSRRISEASLQTVAECHDDDGDEEGVWKMGSTPMSTASSLATSPVTRPSSLPLSPTASSEITPDEVTTSETPFTMRKISIPGKTMLDFSLNKLMNIKTDVVQGFIRSRGQSNSDELIEEEDPVDEDRAANKGPVLPVAKDFYISLIQTCLHTLGKEQNAGHNPLQMAAHIQKVFGVHNSIHGDILKDQLNKPPETYMLRVTIVEARDVLPMDPNGLSDPYCIVTLCRKDQHHQPSPNKITPSNSLPENNSPMVQRKFNHSSQSTPATSTLFPPSPKPPPKKCASTPNSPPGSLSGSETSSPLMGYNDNAMIAGRNATRNRSFRRRRRRKSSETSMQSLSPDEMRLRSGSGTLMHHSAERDEMRSRSGTDVDCSRAYGSIGSVEAESMIRTECKKQTLHPVWNETFDLEVNSANVDLLELRLTMWDWDEETSLWQAFKGLETDHKLAGIKNIFRHVKGGINKSTDDYMGQLVVPLLDIPNATRVDKWYGLHHVHGKHLAHQAGKVHLKFNFVRKQKFNETTASSSSASGSATLDHYHQLAMAMYKYEGHKHIRESGTPWDGKVSDLSRLVLNYYAIQHGVMKLSQQIINLTALLSFHHHHSIKPPAEFLDTKSDLDEPDSAGSIPIIPSLEEDIGNPTISGPVKQLEPVTLGQKPEDRAGSARKKVLDPVLNDRGIREATYNIHAETVSVTSVNVYEGEVKSVTEIYENNPEFLVFEMGLAEMSVCAYVDICMKTLPEVPSLFPPSDLDTLEILQSKCRLQNIHTLLSMKVWQDKDRAPHRLVRETLTSNIENSTRMWLNAKLSRLPNVEGNLKPHELVELLDRLGQVLDELCPVYKTNKDYKNFFMRFHMDYYKTVTRQIDHQITRCLGDTLNKLQQYQVRYQKFPENISESSKASLKLFMLVKRLVHVTGQCVVNRDELELSQFHTWFQEPLIFWLRTFKHETFERVHRALDMDKDVVLVHQVVKFSNSSVDVKACFAKVTEEWHNIGFEGPHPRCVAITKLTELVCEGVKLYANRVHWILEENGFYKADKETKFDIKDKLCITLNNIEQVREYLDNLPRLLEWDKTTQDLAKEHNDQSAGKRTLDTLHRLANGASADVLMMSSKLERKIANRMCREVSKFMDKVINSDEDNEEYLDELLGYIDNQLQTLYKQLLPQIFPRIVAEVWEEIVRRITTLMQTGKPASYYDELRASLESLEAYFQRPGINLSASRVRTKEYNHLDNHLQLNSKSTHQLMMEYYKHLATDVSTPLEYFGHISIKMIYGKDSDAKMDQTDRDDTSKETRNIVVKVCNATGLPGMDRTGLSDPYVMVEVQPETASADHKICRTKIKEQTLKPVFNETFQFDDVPVSVIESGGVISLTVMDYDFLVPDDYIGEVFYPLKLAQRVGDLQAIDDASVIMLPIKRPHASTDKEFEVLKSRSPGDQHAKQFLLKRTRAIEKQKPRTDTKKSSGASSDHFADVGKKLSKRIPAKTDHSKVTQYVDHGSTVCVTEQLYDFCLAVHTPSAGACFYALIDDAGLHSTNHDLGYCVCGKHMGEGEATVYLHDLFTCGI